jgi:hypothetical protein
MIIAVWAVLIALLEFLSIFSKAFLALFACKCLATRSGRSSLEGRTWLLTISVFCSSSWSACSWWHSAQSNHFRPIVSQPLESRAPGGGCIQHGDLIETCAFKICLLASTSACSVQTRRIKLFTTSRSPHWLQKSASQRSDIYAPFGIRM